MSVSLVRRRLGVFAVAIAASALLAECSAGLIHGELQQPSGIDMPVHMTWRGNDIADRDTMHAAVNGVSYSGPFFEMTPRTARDVAPLWDHWQEGCTDWPYRSGDNAVTPQLGGGHGECQLQHGATIRARF